MTTAQIVILAILLFFNHAKVIKSADDSKSDDSSKNKVLSSSLSTSDSSYNASSLERIDRNVSSEMIVSDAKGDSDKTIQNCAQKDNPCNYRITQGSNQNASPNYYQYNRGVSPGTTNPNLPRRRRFRRAGGYRRYDPFKNRNTAQRFRKYNPKNINNQKVYRKTRPISLFHKKWGQRQDKKEDKQEDGKEDKKGNKQDDKKADKQEDKKEDKQKDKKEDKTKSDSVTTAEVQDTSSFVDSSSSTIFSISTGKKSRVSKALESYSSTRLKDLIRIFTSGRRQTHTSEYISKTDNQSNDRKQHVAVGMKKLGGA